MIIVKDTFTLLKGTPNILSLSSNVISAYEISDNARREAFALLQLNEKSVSHFSKDKIYNLMGNIKDRQRVQLVKLEDYILPVTLNKPTKDIIINLKAFDVSSITGLGVKNLFASLVYGYSLGILVNNKIKIGEIYAEVITNFLLSVFIRVFGREYGLLGAYAQSISELKFLIACYVLDSFFGVRNHKKLFSKAISFAPFNYQEIYPNLIKYDFSDITQFVKALSELKIMPGITQYSFTSKILRFLSLNFLPALEDLSRFISVIVTSSVKGSSLVPAFISSYNKTAYSKILEIGKLIFR